MDKVLQRYILAFDEINALTTATYYSTTGTEQSARVKQISEDTLSILINAYKLGMQNVSEMLAYDLAVNIDLMKSAIYLVIDGKTFEDRIKDHVIAEDFEGLQTLEKSEFHRVYNAAAQDGAMFFNDNIGYGVTKNWYTVMDDKVRETHVYLEGASTAVDEEFYTFDNDHAPYPGAFTKPENNVNCRCIVRYEYDGLQE